MIDSAFPTNKDVDYTEDNNKAVEKPKQYVKTQDQPDQASAPTAEAGYGNVGALLTLTIMFSIVTIIMAVVTILSK